MQILDKLPTDLNEYYEKVDICFLNEKDTDITYRLLYVVFHRGLPNEEHLFYIPSLMKFVSTSNGISDIVGLLPVWFYGNSAVCKVDKDRKYKIAYMHGYAHDVIPAYLRKR